MITRRTSLFGNLLHGTWEHDRIRFDKKPSELANNIVSIMQANERSRDPLPYEKENRETCNMQDWKGKINNRREQPDNTIAGEDVPHKGKGTHSISKDDR